MAITVKLELQNAKLLHQQTTDGLAELQNGSRTPLEQVNPQGVPGAPCFVLTDTATGKKTIQRIPKIEGESERPQNLAPGASLKYPFSLTNTVNLPGPGVYELQALYEWQGGEAASPPVKLEILPSTPLAADVASTTGGGGDDYLCAWVNKRAPADKGGFELWLSEINTFRKPRVVDCYRLAELKKPVEPVISVPPNMGGLSRWVAWLEEKNLVSVIQHNRKTAGPHSFALDQPDYKIIPPLLLVPAAGPAPATADALLYRKSPEAAEGQLVVVHLEAAGKNKADSPVRLPGAAPVWARTAYLSDRRRLTFFVLEKKSETTLQLCSWSTAAPPGNLDELAAWDGKILAADFCVTPEDHVRGVVLLQPTGSAAGDYWLVPWLYGQGRTFELGKGALVSVPNQAALESALLSVSAHGRPAALLQTAGKKKEWFFCGADGAVSPLAGSLAAPQTPVDLLFRRSVDPVLIMAEPERGFRLEKPR